MKRTLFKQLMMSALFACSLSADVPDVGQISKRPTSNAQHPTSNVKHPMSAFGLAAHQTGACAFGLCDGHAKDRPILLSALTTGTMPDPMAWTFQSVWPLDGFGIHPMDRACVRWDVLPSVSPEAMNVPTDPLDAAFLVPRYRMPLALQESAWPAFADLPTPTEAGFAKAGTLRAGRPRPVGSRLRESASSVANPGSAEGFAEARAMADNSPWQVGEPDQSLDVVGRSDRADIAAMIPRLKKVFVKEGVPQQWVWIAEVESALNPRAKSSAGAAGLFQLMPGTARRFGLRTTPVDDRMEPEKSAGAAAQYLKFLRREFGCWSLALAAYNAGEGRVKKTMKKRKARTFNEVERYLPSETRAYVPKVMAIVALREDQLHGVPGAYWMP